MFRNSAWFLCVVLLCIGHTLSQENPKNGDKVVPKVEEHSEPKSSNVETPQPKANVPTKTNSADESSNKVDLSLTTTDKPKPPEPITTGKTAAPSTTTTESTSTTSSSKPPSSTSSTKPPSPPPSSTTESPVTVTPTPGPQKGSWNVTNDKNITCLRIDGIFSIDYSYSFNKTDNKVHLDVPKRAISTGDCSKITLSWKLNSTTPENTLEFSFKKIDNGSDYVLGSISGQIFIKEHNKTEKFNPNDKIADFKTPVNQSYSCSAIRSIAVNNHTKVTLEEFHLQAYKTSNSTGFDSSVDCAGSEHTPDIVPIIVGCVLALLVIAVLVAYLISRRRSQTRGYLSM